MLLERRYRAVSGAPSGENCTGGAKDGLEKASLKAEREGAFLRKSGGRQIKRPAGLSLSGKQKLTLERYDGKYAEGAKRIGC